LNVFGFEFDYMMLFFVISAVLMFIVVYSLAGRSKRKQKIPAEETRPDPPEKTRQPALSTASAALPMSGSKVEELRAYVDALRGRKALELSGSIQGLLQKYAEEDESLITSLKEKEAELEAKRRPVGLDPEEQAALTRLIAKETLTTDEQIWLSRLLKQAGSTLETKAAMPLETKPSAATGKGKNPEKHGKPLIEVIGG